jgi:radical SAM superfamily enzyme YgiQ (UPF0313 family)
VRKTLNVHFLGMSQDHHSRLKTISLAPFDLKAYVDARCREEFPNVVKTKASDFFWDTTPEEILSHIEIKNTDLVCFSVYTWNNAELYETSRLLKEKNKNIIIALGGPEVAPMAMDVIQKRPQADIVPFTPLDGELIAYNIVKALITGADLSTVQGIVYRKPGNKIVQNAPLEKHLDLNTVPSPYITGDISFEGDKDYIATVETSRGCPFDCGYCFWGKTRGVTFFPLERVFKDIEVIYSNPHVKEVHFTDSDFFINKTRAKAILEQILKQKREVITYFEINAKTITEDLARLAGKLKGFQFILSPQTANPDSLEAISSHRDPPAIFIDRVNLIRKVVPEPNITTAIILGLPEDTLPEFKKTIDFCLSLEPSKLNVGYPLYLLPGSRFYEARDSMGFKYTTEPICAVLETPTFPKKDMNEAVRLICWVQLFIVYLPAVRNFLYQISRKNKKADRVAVIEKWADAIEKKLKLLPEGIDLTDTVAASVKKWNEVKRDFFLKGSETNGSTIIYQTIYDLEKSNNLKEMGNTIEPALKVFKYFKDNRIDSFTVKNFKDIVSKLSMKEADIKDVLSVFKK